MRNLKSDPPMIFVEEIKEISSFKKIENKISGKAWYKE